ncbi:hypothetical protein [Streptomyces sp. CA-111067]|uniref:hypothetical protein n=1 Tax=Streptomyces sp. CA-111067 TaxID=3240046 RepID=UPI003D95C897
MSARPARDRLFALMATKPTKRERALDAYRAEVLAEAADRLTAIADEAEARVAEHYGAASGIGPGSADMVREAARTVRDMAGKDTREGESTTAAGDDPAALLALATVLEIPRPVSPWTPLQLRLSYGHADRWAICDRTGRRWYPEGWMYEPDDDRLCDDGRFALAVAVPLARRLAEGEVRRG